MTLSLLPQLRNRPRARGQSVVELALVMPILLIMLVAVADLARLYATMMSVESAAREASDFGAFYTGTNWAGDPGDPTSNESKTLAEMTRRACIAASDLPDYVGPDDACVNPHVVSITQIEPGGGVADCATVPRDDPPCLVETVMEYDFHLLVPLRIEFGNVTLGIPSVITFQRSSTFAMSDFELDQVTP